MSRKVIVIVPVRNEEWVLDFFLRVASTFADGIIVADQCSKDRTKNIALSFEKVHYFYFDEPEYDEAKRQVFLINQVRNLYPGENVVIALDADEIIAADGLDNNLWNALRSLEKGTSIFFRKVDLLPGCKLYIDYEDAWYPLGWVDDGVTAHKGKAIHSIRIPFINEHSIFRSEEITVLHLQRLRPNVQEAKRCFYQIVERNCGNMPWYFRRKRYNYEDFHGMHLKKKFVVNSWLNYGNECNIDLTLLKDEEYNWFNDGVIDSLLKYGSMRYWLDDIWGKDWKAYALANNRPILNLKPAPVCLRLSLKVFDACFNLAYALKLKLKL